MIRARALLAIVALASASCADAPRRIAPAALDRAVQEIEREFLPEGPGVAVAVHHRGARILHRAAGRADIASGRTLAVDAAMPIGSITKPVTALAVLLLAQDGRLRLSQTVGELLPEYAGPGRAVTVEQLLNHSAGIPNFVDRDDFESLARRPHTPAQLLALFAAEPLVFAPGTRYEYSDSGYEVLGAIVERSSGLVYGEFVRARIAAPLGLDSLRFGLDRAAAVGYTHRDGAFLGAEPIDMSVAYAAGGLRANADDLVRLFVALHDGALLDAAHRALAWNPARLASGAAMARSLVWGICELDGRETRQSGGFIPGYRAYLLHVVAEDLTVAVVSNADDGAADPTQFARRLARTLLEGAPDQAAVALTPAERAALVGRYRFEGGGEREIFERDGRIHSRRGAGEPRELVALAATRFALAGSEGTVVFEFERDASGRAVSVSNQLDCGPLETAVRVAEGTPP